MIDVHAHLADPVFDGDRSEVLQRAAAAGVQRVVTVGENLSDAERVLQLSVDHPMLAPCAGLYPTILDRDQLQMTLDFIRLHRDSLIAIGEIGMDRWVIKEDTQRALQRDLFREQVKLSIELDLPVNVHSRSAGQRTIAALLEWGARRVLMHAFDGRAAAAREGVRAGYFFSIPPSIVRSRQKQKLVRSLPLEQLLLETDSPVLGATTDQRNEPSQVFVSCKAIAEIHQLDQYEVARTTTDNARRLFGDRLIE